MFRPALTRRQPGRVWWSAPAFEEALSEAQRSFPLETGGLLLGWSTGPSAVVISHVIGPGPGANHQATSFLPDAPWQQNRLDHAYEAAGRRLQYLGDWHTHPQGACQLSSTDRATLRRIARHAEARVSHPVMAVIAGGPLWKVAVHRHRRGHRPPAMLALDIWTRPPATVAPT